MSENNDHDLLVRIDEQVKQMRIMFDADRAARLVSETKQAADLDTYKRDTSVRIGKVEEGVDGLKQSRAQIYGIAGTIAFIISALFKYFWPAK